MLFEILKWAGFISLMIAGTVSVYSIGYYDHPKFKIKVALPIVVVSVLVGLVFCFCAIAVKA